MQLAKKILTGDLTRFGQYLREWMQGDSALFNKISDYILRHSGKQVRPVFVLLSAHLAGKITEQSYRAAVLVELLHNASLVHDDIVDDAAERRGQASVNALWKSRTAVLVGDVMFSNGMLQSLSIGDHKILKIFSDAIEETIIGELEQLTRSKKLNLKEDVYYTIIRQKTAALLKAACRAGAASATNDESIVEKIALFGEKVGMAFQIRDDLFDYGTEDVGKPVGNDIQEKKVTLPLIYTIANCSPAQRKELLYIIRHQNTNKERIAYLISVVTECGGLDYATERMYAFRDEALAILNTFDNTEVKDALEEIVRYTTDRKY